ncbi:MAG: TonB-dependent receptor, partial [Parabacteroides sp.]
IPAGAVKEITDIVVTEYIAGEVSADMSSLSTINCQPDGLTFEKPVSFKIKNQMSGDVQFADVKHYILKDGVWKEEAPAAFDAESNAYVITMNGFSDHSAKVGSSFAKSGNASEQGSAITISNKGNMSSKKQNVSYKSKSGWEAGEISGAEGASEADKAALKSAIAGLAASQMGTQAGVSEQTIDLGEANIDGDCDVTYTPEIQTETRTLSVPVIIGGKRVNVSMTIKVFTGVNIRKEIVYGEHHTDHSGGSMGR